MSITINGNGTITGYTPATISGTLAGSNMPSGSIIQTVVGTNGYKTTAGPDLTGSVSSPTFLDSDCKVTITPIFSNSKICITWSAQLRIGQGCKAFVGIYYSPNSNMSSPTVIEKSRGANNSLNETYRENDDTYTTWSSWSRVTWDETVSNTNTRYYNVGGWADQGNAYYGDNGLALQIMAQEIKV